MFGLGMTELVLILVLVLFFTGAKKLPLIGEGLGKGIREFKKALRDKTSLPKER
jgi:sec-independent protein translocase protein TatA